MKILVTNDVHQHMPKWEQLIVAVELHDSNAVIVAGDLFPKDVDRWEDAQLEYVEGLMCEHFAKLVNLVGRNRVFLQLGNDDHHTCISKFEEKCAEAGVVSLNHGVYKDDEFIVCGMNRVRDYPFGYKYWVAPELDYKMSPVQYSRDEKMLAKFSANQAQKLTIADRLSELAESLSVEEMRRSIWLIHQPPSEMGMDILYDGGRVGSPEVLDFIQNYQPLMTCHGHIHESPDAPDGRWCGLVDRTMALQPGQAGNYLDYVIVDMEERTVTHSRPLFGEAACLLQGGLR